MVTSKDWISLNRKISQPAYGQRVLAFHDRRQEWYVAYYHRKTCGEMRGYFEEIQKEDYNFDDHVTYWLPCPPNPATQRGDRITTKEAADILDSSEDHVMLLIEVRQLPSEADGMVLSQDVVEYKQVIDRDRMRVLDELVAEAEELGLGYD